MPKLKTKFRLPPPKTVGGEYEWLPVVRVGRIIPFGYYQDPDDPQILQPIPEELELLEEAKRHLKQYSQRDVAAWLSEQSGRYISHPGLMERIKIEQRRTKEATNSRNLAKQLEEALEKAKKAEARWLGRKQKRDSTGDSEA